MSLRCRTLQSLAACAFLASAWAQPQSCQTAQGFIRAVDMHLAEWDNQIEVALNSTWNCSIFMEFIYMSRDRIRMQLDYIRGNYSAEEQNMKQTGEEKGSATWVISHMSSAASLISAHLHVHGVLASARPRCLSEHLQLLFLMSLRRMKTLLHGQLRHLWVVFQGSGDVLRHGASKWLHELVDLFEADLRTMESLMGSWTDPDLLDEMERADTENRTRPIRPGPPLPSFFFREEDLVSLSTIEVLRRETFEDWNVNKPLLRALLRYVIPRDTVVADFCAGTGVGATFLNETGLVKVFAFDPSPNIKLLSRGVSEFVRLSAGPVGPGRGPEGGVGGGVWQQFDVTMCLTASEDFGARPEVWDQVWQNIEALSLRGAILTCGQGEVRQQAMASAAQHAPGLRLDEALTQELDKAFGVGLCIFGRPKNL